ncbi:MULTISPECIES: nicotinate-nucleotide adenylyltransferase [Bacillus]|uniref:Probable nicotinate-nucleotide adenylyltransferase n=2 Tax=Bacillus TaxID=1386 RepID=A0A0M4G8V0_9BACI|nr:MULTISPECIES: nicotinate-nucleotide adenylyltransferase [Bacillus]ALC81695.1 nicotinate-nucleotide adenylyltransferase [Bacillus gobiensis]MBP1080748.1 nicotinate-nucleotide adenylyltransferase [Bacillus capparidis]MED1094603.1 nicotinate-nucleotide adenylyltransferase [Bacillus capparidis]
MKKIGIFGGTFDPPHNGHLLMANEVLHRLCLDEVWFLPNQIPPHKQEEKFSDSGHRIEMLKLAIESNPSFKLQLIEMERPGPSYTYDTMVLLKEKYPDYQFYFIIGADMVEYLPKWHKIDELLEIVQFTGVKRIGFHMDTPYPVRFVDVPEFEVSSTMIRDRVDKNEPINYLISEKVRRYIEENGLYESRTST